jgi:hypothetical protein
LRGSVQPVADDGAKPASFRLRRSGFVRATGTLSSPRETRLSPTPAATATALKGLTVNFESMNANANVLASVASTNAVGSPMPTTPDVANQPRR